MIKTKLPNFLIVGAHKAGTTSLYHYLKQHPEIFLSDRKEGLFFSGLNNFSGIGSKEYNKTIIKNFSDYQKLFKNVVSENAIGDISPDYLFFYENSIEKIKKYLGEDVKIIIILRNPILRAYSNYTFYFKLNLENLSFKKALEKEDQRHKSNLRWAFRYKEIGLYYEQVKKKKKAFKNILILDFDELKSSPQNVTKKIFEFLDVDKTFQIDTSEKHNTSGIPSNRLLHYLLTKRFYAKTIIYSMLKPLIFIFFSKKKLKKGLKKRISNNFYKTPIAHEDKVFLEKFYRQDIIKLQDIVDFDVKKWLNDQSNNLKSI